MSNPEPKPSTGFIKNRGKYFFKINRQGQVCSTNQVTLSSDDQRVKIFLNGVIYNHNKESLVEGFYSHGVEYIAQVEGSFIIFLMAGTQFFILTDKTNSKKGFYALLGEDWYVSNDIDSLPKDKCQLSLEGIACYLSNGCMLSDLTLFEEIKTARRASVHCIENGELCIHPYWEFKFENPAYTPDQYQQYEDELETLLIGSVSRCYSASTNPTLSLSAGNDSRSILGILYEKLKAPKLLCFSYALDEIPGKHTDAALSMKLAANCGYSHQTILSYKGDLVALLKNNAREGKCLSNFCDEVDVWHELADENQVFDIFVGDKCFGHLVAKSGSKTDILASVPIQDALSIHWLGNFISKRTYRLLYDCINKLTDEIYESANDIPDPFERGQFIYFDQRTDHYMLPWREYFSSQVGFVHNPFLDRAFLEFFTRMPRQLRKDRYLYKRTIKKMFPDLFSIGHATIKGNKFPWHKELLIHKDDLISFVNSTNSRLDEIITRNEVLDAIRQYGTWDLRLMEYVIKVFNFLLRKILGNKAIKALIGSKYHPKGSPIFSEKLLIRLLLIRIYLSMSS